ncbi:MAG: hemerythrin domain-containing protein [Firmicutes bacterium]|nr:hemerythrin domain-containing protein [Bacillota bacterium]
MQFRIPESLELEHEELHLVLSGALEIEGEMGADARAVANVLHPHFVKENTYAMPPLGLLRVLFEGDVTPEMANVLPLVDRLKADMPEMLSEHKAIVSAVQRLRDAAAASGLDEYVRFADRLKVHAQTEEEVLYPASVLVGEYVRTRLGG